MRRLRLLTFVAPLLSALSCTDSTAPKPARPQIRDSQRALAIPTTTPQVAAGGYHTCALMADATVICWGYNFHGESTVPGALVSAAQISAGENHTCALKTDGTVACWGFNAQGQLMVPAGLTTVAQIEAGGWNTCALKTDGTVTCWGDNAYGQATVPEGLGSVIQLGPGLSHTCALKADATVVCWGRNDYGQATVPDGLSSVAQVSAGFRHTCALKRDATVICWGSNAQGQATVPDGLASVAQVSNGGYHTCALMRDGTVACWGNNEDGEATPPSGLASVSQVSAGSFHTCALKTDRTVICWGYNAYGQATVPAGLNLTSAPLPIANAGGPYTGYEGAALTFNGTGSSDPNGGALTYSWNFGDGSIPGTGAAPIHTYRDNGHYTVTLTVSNGTSRGTPATTTATIANVAPSVRAITAPMAPVQVNTTIAASASITDAGTLDTHTAVFNWGDGTSSAATVTETNGFGSANGDHIYSTAGVYTITLTVTDNYQGTGQSVFEFVVVYDPAAGFVTGDGSIDSPAGAYAADPTLTGQAKFGFVSRYQKGATIPSGNTQFQFQAGDLKFKSTSYDWLVIAGSQAKYKGSGTINGAGDFGFLLSAVDGAANGGGGTDKFRIKIWDKHGMGSAIYDNQMDGTDDAAATTVIAGGDILIHN